MIKILYAPSATAHVQKRGKDTPKTKLLATSHNYHMELQHLTTSACQSSDFGLRVNLMMTWTRSLPMMLNALEATYVLLRRARARFCASFLWVLGAWALF